MKQIKKDTKNKKSNNKDVNIELIRIVACFIVIALHISLVYYNGVSIDKSKLSSLQLNNKFPDLYTPSINVSIEVTTINTVNRTNSIFTADNSIIIASEYEYITPIKITDKIIGKPILVKVFFFFVLTLNKFIPSDILAFTREKIFFILFVLQL